MSDAFVDSWKKHVTQVENGLAQMRRSSAMSLLPFFDTSASGLVLTLHPKLQDKGGVIFKASNPVFQPEGNSVELQELTIDKYNIQSPPVLSIDGIKFTLSKTGHAANIAIYEGTEFYSRIRLQLVSAELMPVYPRDRDLRAALRNMTGQEADKEVTPFTGQWALPVPPAKVSTGGAKSSLAEACLELIYENRSTERDAVWVMTLFYPPGNISMAESTFCDQTSIQILHAPFTVFRTEKPDIAPQAGEMLAQWLSNDPQGAQWRFAMDKVTMQLPPQATGETMERGARLWGQPEGPIEDNKPILHRFSRCTQLTVKPSRVPRRYTVHPGDILSTLKDAQLEQLTVEVGYPLEISYQRTEHATRTVVVTEIGETMGHPAVSLAQQQGSGSQLAGLLKEAMSDSLAQWYALANIQGLSQTYTQLRSQHLANRASLRHRLAMFTLKDARFPDKPLDLTEELTATLRSRNQSALPICPLTFNIRNEYASENWATAFLASDDEMPAVRKMPIGLLYTLEFASELQAVLRSPDTLDVRIQDLALSALGATGTVQASFDNSRTTFEVSSSHGQAWRIVKSRVGRIAAAWNHARHVVIYGRSTVPSSQFSEEQNTALHRGRPMLRKLEEYIEILEPRRVFSTEKATEGYGSGCLHSYHFATTRIYVNSAWGHDLRNNSGYEIALYNPDDRSGFYVKPWLGPVAFDANASLVPHWHEHPEDVYFYTCMEAGLGADTDTWPAREEIDFQTIATLGVVSPASTAALLSRKVVPDYTLSAVGNPRFTQRVLPEGQSNMAHGRSDKALLAFMRTVQFERTSATSRVEIKAEKHADLIKVVSASAEARSIENLLISVLKTARQRWQSLVGDCKHFKERLKQEVEDAHREAETALHTIDETKTNVAASVQGIVDTKMSQWETGFANALNGERCKSQVSEFATTCLQPLSRHFQMLIEQSTPVTPEAITALKVRVEQDLAECMLRGQRLLAPVKSICQSLRDCQKLLESPKKYQDLAEGVDQTIKAIETLLSQTPATARGNIDKWIDNTDKQLHGFRDVVSDMKAPLQERQPVAVAVLIDQLLRWVISTEGTLSAAMQALAAFRTKVAECRPDETLSTLFNTLLQQPLQLLNKVVVNSSTILLKQCDALVVALQPAIERMDDLTSSFPFPVNEMTAIRDDIIKLPTVTPAELTRLKGVTDALSQYCLSGVAPGFATDYDKLIAPVISANTALRKTIESFFKDLIQHAAEALSDVTQQATVTLDLQVKQINAIIDNIDCTADNPLIAFEAQLDETARCLREQLSDCAGPLLDEATRHLAHAAAVASGVEGAASSVLKTLKTLIDPPEIPHFSINSRQIECVFDDVKSRIETSPCVARLHEMEEGIRDLGMALPVQGFEDSLKAMELQGLRFNEIIKQAGMDFQALLDKFRLPALPPGTILLSHNVDVKKRTASVSVNIDHTFSTTEQVLNIAGFSLDIQRPHLLIGSHMESSVSGTTTRIQARFGGDWIMRFGGQPLVTFRNAMVQYSDNNGFSFDLDPKNVYPHPTLLFITQILQQKMPRLPEGATIEKDGQGKPVGVSLVQESSIGPYDFGTVFIGQATIRSTFAVRMVEGGMSVASGFDLGTAMSPVFMLVGVYGGGGWLNARAQLIPGASGSSCNASMAVSLGSTRSFNLAGVASGSYAVRLYLEASMSSEGGSHFTAGLSMMGSARVLGFLNAYLSLVLEVTHSDGKMEGKGRIDIEIEICWCYSVRVNRAVNQTL